MIQFIIDGMLIKGITKDQTVNALANAQRRLKASSSDDTISLLITLSDATEHLSAGDKSKFVSVLFGTYHTTRTLALLEVLNDQSN